MLRLKAEERSLLRELRSAQADLARYYAQDSDMERAMAAMQADHEVALRRAEEAGYQRGLDDAKKFPETLGLAKVVNGGGRA